MDIGLVPISDQDTCKAAAWQLALVETNVRETNMARRPEGCYYFINNDDKSQTLWFSSNPLNRGRGAESVGTAMYRQPICSTPKAASSAGPVVALQATTTMQ